MITGKYREFYDQIRKVIPTERLRHDALSTLAFGTDASFYRLIPKLVIRANNENEVQEILRLANQMKIAVTFRAAGTSLSGQAISDSILVIASHNWHNYKILDNGNKILLEPGIRGNLANRYLAPFNKKIGPDPASIDAAMIGGIAANNASGMCCGTSQNSYKTIADIRVILHDGTILDTADAQSVASFKESHKELIEKIEAIAKEIQNNPSLKAKIEKKYKIKNTTGYSLNAYVDYSDSIDILKHLIIGSEGTLAFISNITYNTVVEHKHKSLAIIYYKSIEDACKVVQILKAKCNVSAVEILDRAAIKSVENRPGVPEFVKDLSAGASALLIETRSENEEELQAQVDTIIENIKDIEPELPYTFTTDPKEQADLWRVRKETLPTVAGMREAGTTSIIEDVCFPIESLAKATLELQTIFTKHGYNEAVIFGHALEGNLHFMFNQDFGTESEVERYKAFMDDVANMVVGNYNGSLKAEHGTGRNMAPFVELEWGEDAYKLMIATKNAFDPDGILNPGVIINNDPLAHIKNLKPIPATKPVVDKCMECGFCEGSCVAEGLTLSPRQRVASFREIERLKASGEQTAVLSEMLKEYKYMGMDTCATDSLCFLKCPVGVDAGKLIKELRHESHSPKGEKRAIWLSKQIGPITSFARGGLKFLNGIRLVVGKKFFGCIATSMRKISGNSIPLWNEYMPTGAKKIKKQGVGSSDKKVVYFPSCITRSMGTTKAYSEEKEISQITEALLVKAGYEIIYPENLNKLCCGMVFSSKGYVEAGKRSSDELKAALIKASENGKYPILCDMSPCLYTMHTNMDDELKLYEPAEFIDTFLLENLPIEKVDKKVAIFAVCTAKKLLVDQTLVNIAKRCAKEVVVADTNCCGFAGDRGFFKPELNSHGLRNLKKQLEGCQDGYSTSRTCEIGLSKNSGIVFKSILYLVAEASGVDIKK